jgi:Holliday junction resolvase RusA-like endonuclease
METELACKSFENNDKEKWFQMVLKCTEFPSVNSAHGFNIKKNLIFDQPWVTQFRSEIRDQLIISDPVKQCTWLNPNDIFYLCIKFIIKRCFYSRDYDNMIKIFQDEIAAAVHINDSHIVEGHQYKDFKPGDYEYAIIRFGISEHNYMEFIQ